MALRILATIALSSSLLVAGCEDIGAPDAYRTAICGATADLSGPVADAVTNLTTAAAGADPAATRAALDQLDTVVAKMSARLVDVPLWETGAAAAADLRAIAAAYRTAVAAVRQADSSGDPAALQASIGALATVASVAPNLGDHLRQARVKGLNC